MRRDPLPAYVRRFIIDRDERICDYCGGGGNDRVGPDGLGWHIDHVVAVARGGSNDLQNLVLSCKTCNLRKSAKTREDFISDPWRPRYGRRLRPIPPMPEVERGDKLITFDEAVSWCGVGRKFVLEMIPRVDDPPHPTGPWYSQKRIAARLLEICDQQAGS